MPALVWETLDDASLSPRSLSPPQRAITPRTSEIRQRDLSGRCLGLYLREGATSTGGMFPPAGLFFVPAVKGIHSSKEWGPPAGGLPVPSVAAVIPQSSKVRQSAVLCLFTRYGFVSPTMQRAPCRRVGAYGAFQARFAHFLWCLSHPVVLYLHQLAHHSAAFT